MTDPNENHVNGEQMTSKTGGTTEVTSPANPSEVVAAHQHSNENDAAATVDAAVAAEDEQRNTPGLERGRILRKAGTLLAQRKDELTEILTAKEGKAQPEVAGEVQRTIDILHYFSSKAADPGGTKKGANGPSTNLYTRQGPVGVAALVTPWNYPIAVPAWKLIPALAAGNTVVLESVSVTPGIVVEIARVLDEAGLPDGALNVVTEPGSSVGSGFIGDRGTDLASFTGSSQVGEMMYEQATDTGKHAQTELGGKNPMLVTDSANPAGAADIIANGGFGTTGRSCTTCSRAIVHEDVYDDFVAKLVDHVESLDVGPDTNHEIGPQVDESELSPTLEYIDIVKAEGAAFVAGGSVPEDEAVEAGHFVGPTAFADVDPDMHIAREKISGPVVAAVGVNDFDGGLTVTSDVDYGLSVGIVTDNHTEANRFVDEVEAGVVKVNDKTTGLELHVPFGGFKRSSSKTWREQGDAGLDFYTIEKTVYDSY